MRPVKQTAAHKTGYLGELVCSNSLKSEDVTTAQGLLKRNAQIGFVNVMVADQCRVAAGSALAVDRNLMGRLVTETITKHPLIDVVVEEVKELPESRITVVASGPLTSKPSLFLAQLTGSNISISLMPLPR